MDLGLGGKRVLITGASQGIGAGLAKAFADEGASLILTARNTEKLKAVQADIEANTATAVKVIPARPDGIGRLRSAGRGRRQRRHPGQQCGRHP